MSIVLPDLSPTNTNFPFRIANLYGVQMIGLSFQNFDNYMKDYTQYFDNEGYAFVLKPESLRYIPVFIPKPPDADPNVSYESLKISFNDQLADSIF